MKLEIFGQELKFDDDLVEESEAEIRRQISEYLSGEREVFDLEFSVPESFTGRVMQEMLKMGGMKSHGEIAESLDLPRSR